VFALGTYVSCDKDCTNYAIKVDLNIALTLLNTVAKDMSPMVREVIVRNNCILFSSCLLMSF